MNGNISPVFVIHMRINGSHQRWCGWRLITVVNSRIKVVGGKLELWSWMGLLITVGSGIGFGTRSMKFTPVSLQRAPSTGYLNFFYWTYSLSILTLWVSKTSALKTIQSGKDENKNPYWMSPCCYQQILAHFICKADKVFIYLWNQILNWCMAFK